MGKASMLKLARKLLTSDDADHTDTFFPAIQSGQIVSLFDAERTAAITRTGSARLAELVETLRSSDILAADISTTIADAARINTMNDERATSATETLVDQMKAYAEALNRKIVEVQAQQSEADQAHADALANLKREIEEREQVHKELTEANDATIADHRRALAGIEALRNTVSPQPPARFDTSIPAEVVKPTKPVKLVNSDKD